ncbi:MAG: CBS domain-containing protein [Patescibacteria group bacterium]|nr:CBS domain-containing protein [Patescibacteria group bacterium]MDD5715256.1 CBS domain-containing protein [Patescibacteria group bacterium]
MIVQEIMSRNVVTISNRATLRQAAAILAEHNISGAPVVDSNGVLVGIVSEKDLFKSLYPSHAEFYESPGVWIDLDKLEEKATESADKFVEDLMVRDVITVNPNASLMQVGSIMLVRGIHRVVVVSNEGRIEGIVTRRDIYRNILKSRLKI